MANESAPNASPEPSLEARLAQLEAENAKLRKINRVLVQRVETGSHQVSTPYGVFEHSVSLAELVRERTEELNRALEEVKASHRALTLANRENARISQRLGDAIESISDAFVLFDTGRRIIQFNSPFAEIWSEVGYQIRPGLSLAELDAIAHQSGLISRVYPATESTAKVYLLSNGRWIQMSERPTAEGGLVMLYTDISDLMARESEQREFALAQQAQLMKRTIDNLSQGTVLVNRGGVAELWNQQFLNLTGLTADDLSAGKPFSVLIRSSRALQAHRRQTDLDAPGVAESVYHTSSGQILEIKTHPLPDGSSVYTFTDITERQQHAEQLEARVTERTAELTTLNIELEQARIEAERANLSKTKFLAAVSHDLLQPLNAARLFTASLEESAQEPQTERLAHAISTALDDVENLLRTLVDISKLEAGVIQPEPTRFPARTLLDNLAHEFSELARAQSLSFEYQGQDALIESDSQLLARILRNLLTNAIRYTESGGILLRLRERDQQLHIQIWDSGPGIAKEDQRLIFQEFKRLEGLTQRSDRGLGLGLAIVDKLSRVLNHPVQLRSRVGRGSIFSVSVPIVLNKTQADAQPEISYDPQDHLNGARIWLIDNDPAICTAMTELLSHWGCRVTAATSLAALAQQVDLHRDAVELLIVDYHLDQDQLGIHAAQALLRQRNEPIPVLMITANYSKEINQQIRDLGYQLMHKPVKPLKLKTLLSHLLSKNRAGRG